MRNHRLQRSLAGLFIIFVFVGCKITLISEYDEIIDRGLSDFQRKMDFFLLSQQRIPPPPFDQSFYDGAISDLNVLKVRAASVPKNETTTAIISALISQVELISSTHKGGSASAIFFQIAQKTIDDDCQRALTLELAKKR
jgi:hypothetical protein